MRGMVKVKDRNGSKLSRFNLVIIILLVNIILIMSPPERVLDSVDAQSQPGEWSARDSHASVVLPDGSIVLMGGAGDCGGGSITDVGDVWRSTDRGATWTQMTAEPEWGSRANATSVAMPDGSIVLMGGIGGGWPGIHNDVWRSTDQGATWTRMTTAAEWAPRYGATSVVMPNGSIILIGGVVRGDPTSGGGYYLEIADDVWRSTDQGATWTEVASSIGWKDRSV